MRILLDTHILLWALTEPGRLAKETRARDVPAAKSPSPRKIAGQAVAPSSKTARLSFLIIVAPLPRF